MAQVSIEDIKELRKKTGAGFSDCKKALNSCNSDINKAMDWLKQQGLSQMAKRSDKDASEGQVASYVHTGNRIGVLVEVNTETDFSARSEAFSKFVKDLTLHITAMNPQCISEENLPEALLQKQTEAFREQALKEGKNEKVLDKIIQGRLDKWKKEVCLMDQIFVRPGGDEQEITVKEALAELTNQIREKIVIRRFVRYELGVSESDYVS
ncbi:MAG: translation elongation factor Ts [Bdellovibrionales bacterium]|nr:translation elongation factor Ts [Bdellovibrionales bacterium]